MKTLLSLLIIFSLCSAMVTEAADSPAYESRSWLINAQANNRTTFSGTFVKYDGRNVYIKMPDGYVRKIITGQLSGGDLNYLQGKLSQFPEKISTPADDLDGTLLVELSANSLETGELTEWPNSGSLGGAFHAIRAPLTVVERDEGKAVRFYFGPWAVPVEFQAMVSDVYAPESLAKNGPYTIATWIYNENPLGIDTTRETVFSWHARGSASDVPRGRGRGGRRGGGGDSGTDIGYGVNGRYDVETRGSGAYAGPYGSFGFPDTVFPSFNRWHHIAYVCSGGTNASIKIYIDGKLAVEKQLSGSEPKDSTNPMLLFLGCSWSGSRPQSFFTGDIADFKLYSRTLEEKEIIALYENYPVVAEQPETYPLLPCVNAHNLFDPDPTQPDYFSPEYDGLVSEPFPATIRQNGEYGKIMEGWGQPIIGRTNCPDAALILCAYTMAKTFPKRPDIVEVLEAMDIAGRLDHGGPPWLGYSELTTACYGQSRTFFADPGFYWGGNIMVHEMGHQFHMWGGEHADPDFRRDLYNVFWQNKKDSKWIGDYGGLNMWEYMACAASAYVSDGSEEENICRREIFRKSDPRMFYFLQKYWPGDMLVELTPRHGLHVDAQGVVTNWGNNGGLEYWGKFGLTKYPWSTGSFDAKGVPLLTTVAGVSSVDFNGSSALVWNRRTRECLVSNYAWSVELWALRPDAPAADEILLSWGDAETGARFNWGAGSIACDLGKNRTVPWAAKPTDGTWHHIVYTFEGGGLENTDGTCSVYVDGALDHSAEFSLNIPSGQPISIGGVMDGDEIASGFSGALAHVRVYDYDLSELQLKKHYKEEQPYYVRESLNDGTLFVDLDARVLAVPTEYQSRPLYPESLDKNWLRSWVNRGVLAGKVSNDVKAPEGSDPTRKTVAGVTAIAFDGNDRMISSFEPSDQMMNGPLSAEFWVYKTSGETDGVIIQWGNRSLPDSLITPGQWHLISLTLKDDVLKTYIDGKPVQSDDSMKQPSAPLRMHLGAEWDGTQWSSYFNGAIAQIRISSGELSPEAVLENYRTSDLMRPAHPSPAVGSNVAAERKPMLSWDGGVRSTDSFDLYFNTDHAAVAGADKSSACYRGAMKPGTTKPNLKPGTTYYWRVDSLDETGNVVAKGTVWNFTTYEGLVVAIDAANLPEGPVTTWPNTGRAGGAFSKGIIGDIAAPEVSVWDDRTCVDFTGHKSLVSSFAIPSGMAKGSFSVALWAYNSVLVEAETMMSWGTGDRAATFNYDWNAIAFDNGKSSRVDYGGETIEVENHKTTAPLVTYWHHIVYTYDSGKMKIYVNGILNAEKNVSLDIQEDGKIALGALIDSMGNPTDHLAGMLSDIAIFDYALTEPEIAYIFKSDGSGTKPDTAKMPVLLSTKSLPEGPLKEWKNNGTAGGSFVLPELLVEDPQVKDVAGRTAVTFDGKQTFLQSDITTPARVTGIKPVTVEMLVYNPKVSADETVFSLAPREAFSRVYFEGYSYQSLEFRYARGKDRRPGAVYTGWDVRSIGWKDEEYPAEGEWHHIAFVYDGEHQGTAKVYVDGKLNNTVGFYTLSIQDGLPMYLGTAWNTDYGTQDMFSGALASLKVYDYARTDEEIAEAAQAK